MERHSSFTRRIIIKKDIDSVFNAWAIQGNMENWFLKAAKFFRREKPLESGEKVLEGDTYKWIWHTWPDNVQEGIITTCIPSQTFSFTFDPGGNVEVTFKTINSFSTEIAIKQFDIITDNESWYHYYHGCSLGWSFWLVNLKAFLEYEIVLDQRDIIYKDDRHLQFVNQ